MTTNINILDVIPPSEKQAGAGIHGTVNLEITGPDGTPVCKLNGIAVRKTKDGSSRFLGEPSYPVTRDGDTKYYRHFQMFPRRKDDEDFNNAQRAANDALTEEVLRLLDGGGTKQRAQGATAAPAGNAPATKDPWE